ncbi:sulfite exporter TauE/SafE family protein [Agromyces aurantiacus]|uniref:Probable membrane transporter protein n=1 Tax=Agromyces aurantiacus TaxID=165814 RepID=A0ABV9R095_9MICO|nr:sulfite exporter TauE/SafE family protein [Agromyces aurantiacus]MBM7505848.1 putative membrane protein YfcA [Agromyces aurantiacus]
MTTPPPDPAPPDAGTPPAPAWRFLVVGAVGGLLSGMFGVGGGIVMVPLLILLAGMDQRRASATSLAAIVPTAVAGSVAYLVNGQVDLVAALLVAVGGIAGGWLGAKLLARLPLGWLRWLFIALIVVVAVRLVVAAPERVADPVPLELGPALGLVALGLVVGIASGLFGIGGGLIMVPAFMTLFGLGDLIARGTSLVAMIPTAVSGTLTNVRSGIVDLRAALIAGLAATVAALPGVALAFLVPPAVGAWLFAALLLVAAVQLAVRAVRAQRVGRA